MNKKGQARMNKKGQAAMEFLMTYGWAILVVIAAIAALAYFGVLDPARLLPERCQFPAGMDCIDKAAVSTSDVTFALRNNQGFRVEVESITATATGCTTTSVAVGATNASFTTITVAGNVSVPNNEVFKIQLTGCSLSSGEKFDNDVTVQYTNTESGLTNNAVGNIRGRVS